MTFSSAQSNKVAMLRTILSGCASALTPVSVLLRHRNRIARIGVKWSGAVAAIAFFFPVDAYAKVNAAVIADQPTSPIRIDGCRAKVDAPNGIPILLEAVDFTNVGATQATAVEFEFDNLDAFGSVLGPVMGQTTGKFEAGASIRKATNFKYYLVPAALDSIRCSVNKVRFADGSVWTNPAKPAPTSTPVSKI